MLEKVPHGYKKTEVGVIPDDWEIHTLGDEIESLDAGVSVNSVGGDVHAGDYVILKTSSVFQGKFNPLESKKIRSDDLIRAKLNPKANSLVISRMNTPELVGECGYVENDYETVFLPDRLWQTTLKKNSNINCKWLNYILNMDEYRKLIKESATGTSNSMKNISKDQILNIKVPYPSSEEQTAIAEVLSDIDKLISLLEMLVDKKQSIKQGTMQELLTGKRRLKGFNDEWREKELGEIAYINMGLSPDSKNYNINSIGVPLIQGNADLLNRQTIIRFYTSQITKVAECGDLIMTVRAPVGYIAKATFKCCLGRGVCSISYDNDFLYHYLIFIEDTWGNMSTGSTFDSINSDNLKATKIKIPSTPEEQVAIAQILSDMDEEIEMLTTKLNKYKAIKQGMMQELLTGIRRIV